MSTSGAEARPVDPADGAHVLAARPLRATGRVVAADLSFSVRPALPGRPAIAGPRELRWRLPEPPTRLAADPLVPTLLLLAMRRGEDLRLEGGVSAKLLARAPAGPGGLPGWGGARGPGGASAPPPPPTGPHPPPRPRPPP